MNLQQLEIQK